MVHNVLDLAFVLDCTGSMGECIKTAQDEIRNIVEQIVAAETSDINLALVEYKDHPQSAEDEKERSIFVTRKHDFTPLVKTMKGWLDGCSANGGEDTPEAVADALDDAFNLTWRPQATKICVLICDGPPHGLGHYCTDKFPSGCPDNKDPMEIVRNMAKKGITLYTVGCEPLIRHYKDFFTAIAYITGGQYIPLDGTKALTQIIVGGTQEEISLEKLMEGININEIVCAEMEAKGSEDIDIELLCTNIQSILISQGAKSKQLQHNKVALAEPSEFAKKVASYLLMSDVKSIYTQEAPKEPLINRWTNPPVTGEEDKEKGGLLSGPGSSSNKESATIPLDSDDVTSTTASMAAPPLASEINSYNVEVIDVQFEQIRRMVQKSKMRNMSKFN